MEVTRMINHDDAVLFDVRSGNDFNNAHIINSLNFPEPELDSREDTLQKYKKRAIIICCEHGNVSEKAARRLKNSGFNPVYCLKGGLSAWRSSNLPLTKG